MADEDKKTKLEEHFANVGRSHEDRLSVRDLIEYDKDFHGQARKAPAVNSDAGAAPGQEPAGETTTAAAPPSKAELGKLTKAQLINLVRKQ